MAVAATGSIVSMEMEDADSYILARLPWEKSTSVMFAGIQSIRCNGREV